MLRESQVHLNKAVEFIKKLTTRNKGSLERIFREPKRNLWLNSKSTGPNIWIKEEKRINKHFEKINVINENILVKFQSKEKVFVPELVNVQYGVSYNDTITKRVDRVLNKWRENKKTYDYPEHITTRVERIFGWYYLRNIPPDRVMIRPPKVYEGYIEPSINLDRFYKEKLFERIRDVKVIQSDLPYFRAYSRVQNEIRNLKVRKEIKPYDHFFRRMSLTFKDEAATGIKALNSINNLSVNMKLDKYGTLQDILDLRRTAYDEFFVKKLKEVSWINRKYKRDLITAMDVYGIDMSGYRASLNNSFSVRDNIERIINSGAISDNPMLYRAATEYSSTKGYDVMYTNVRRARNRLMLQSNRINTKKFSDDFGTLNTNVLRNSTFQAYNVDLGTTNFFNQLRELGV